MDKYFTSLGDKAILLVQQHLLNIVVIIALCFILKKISFWLISSYVNNKFKLSHKKDSESLGKKKRTIASILHSVVGVLFNILAVVLVLSELNISLGPFLASAGIAGAIIGFGVQSFIKDLVSGAFILAEDQYHVGDAVTIAGVSGTVKDVGLRTTSLIDTDDNVYYVPHGIIEVVTNRSKQHAVINIRLNLSYQTNLEQARKAVDAAVDKLMLMPKFKKVIIERPSLRLVNDFGLSGLDVSIKGKVKIGYKVETSSALRELLKNEFDKKGIKLATGLVAASPEPKK